MTFRGSVPAFRSLRRRRLCRFLSDLWTAWIWRWRRGEFVCKSLRAWRLRRFCWKALWKTHDLSEFMHWIQFWLYQKRQPKSSKIFLFLTTYSDRIWYNRRTACWFRNKFCSVLSTLILPQAYTGWIVILWFLVLWWLFCWLWHFGGPCGGWWRLWWWWPSFLGCCCAGQRWIWWCQVRWHCLCVHRSCTQEGLRIIIIWIFTYK